MVVVGKGRSRCDFWDGTTHCAKLEFNTSLFVAWEELTVPSTYNSRCQLTARYGAQRGCCQKRTRQRTCRVRLQKLLPIVGELRHRFCSRFITAISKTCRRSSSSYFTFQRDAQCTVCRALCRCGCYLRHPSYG